MEADSRNMARRIGAAVAAAHSSRWLGQAPRGPIAFDDLPRMSLITPTGTATGRRVGRDASCRVGSGSCRVRVAECWKSRLVSCR